MKKWKKQVLFLMPNMCWLPFTIPSQFMCSVQEIAGSTLGWAECGGEVVKLSQFTSSTVSHLGVLFIHQDSLTHNFV